MGENPNTVRFYRNMHPLMRSAELRMPGASQRMVVIREQRGCEVSERMFAMIS